MGWFKKTFGVQSPSGDTIQEQADAYYEEYVREREESRERFQLNEGYLLGYGTTTRTYEQGADGKLREIVPPPPRQDEVKVVAEKGIYNIRAFGWGTATQDMLAAIKDTESTFYLVLEDANGNDVSIEIPREGLTLASNADTGEVKVEGIKLPVKAIEVEQEGKSPKTILTGGLMEGWVKSRKEGYQKERVVKNRKTYYDDRKMVWYRETIFTDGHSIKEQCTDEQMRRGDLPWLKDAQEELTRSQLFKSLGG